MKHRRSITRLAAGLTAFVLVAAFANLALAAHDISGGLVGGFEIDGNYAYDSTPDATYDWNTVSGVVRVDDPADSGADDVFGGGSKEEDPDGWTFESGPKPPGKDDLTRVYHASKVTQTRADLWLAFERLTVQGSGDAHVDFELNQSGATVVNREGETIPARSTGDILVVYDYPGGSKPVDIHVFRWDGSALSGSWVEADIPAGAAYGDINPEPVDRPSGAPFGGGTVGAYRFGEVGVSLVELFGRDIISCPGFTSFWVKSRSSGESINSALKDTVAPKPIDLSSCGSVAIRKVDDKDHPLEGATFQLWSDDDASGTKTPGDSLVAEKQSGGDGMVTFTGLEPGAYVVFETDAPDGYIVDETVSAVVVGFREDVTVEHLYVDPLVLGSIRIVKEDSLGNLVAGVRFILYDDADHDGSYDAGEQADTRSGDPAEAVTDAEGVARIKGLVPGAYRLHEDPATIPSSQTAAADTAVTVVGGEKVSVTFVNPVKPSAIAIDKSGDKTIAHRGDPVVYTMKVSIPDENGLPLHDVTVVDAPGGAATYTSGDDGDGRLEVGEVWSYTLTRAIQPADPNPYADLATVTGYDDLGRKVQATDTFSVQIIAPAISIVKTANPVSGEPGTPVTFTYVITNDGDTTLFGVTVVDDVLGAVGTVPELAAGENITLTTQTILGATPGTVRNVGTAKGKDVLGFEVVATDDATVSIVLGAKLPSTGVQAGNLLYIGAGLLAIGIVLVATTRRRRRI
jgi:LPXTG-motif cell wall-anchored protein